MFDDARKIFGPDFGLTVEDLDKAERKVPVFAIMDTLTPEQMKSTNDNLIKFSLLTPAQQKIVNDALAFDAALAANCALTSSKIHRVI